MKIVRPTKEKTPLIERFLTAAMSSSIDESKSDIVDFFKK